MKHEQITTGNRLLSQRFEAASKRQITIDVKAYEAYLDGSGMSDAQKEDYLKSLWSIMMSFVEIGYGVHPLQDVFEQEACGKLPSSVDQKTDTDSDGKKPNNNESDAPDL